MMIERVVAVRFHEHCEAHSLLPVCQSAYRTYHSIETAVAIIHNKIMRNNEQKNHLSIFVLLDIRAAFNTVIHKLLLDTLEQHFEIQDLALKWYSSFFAERMQTFQVGTDMSKTFAVNCSVPQSSVLGQCGRISLRRLRPTQQSSIAVRYRRRHTKDGELCGCCAQMVRLHRSSTKSI